MMGSQLVDGGWGESSKDLLFAMEQVFIFDNGVQVQEEGGRGLGNLCMMEVGGERGHDMTVELRQDWLPSRLLILPFYSNVSNLCSYTSLS